MEAASLIVGEVLKLILFYLIFNDCPGFSFEVVFNPLRLQSCLTVMPLRAAIRLRLSPLRTL